MASPNTNFDTIGSTTLHNYRKKLEDNIFTAIPLLYDLRRKAQTVESGGDKFVQPLMYAKNTTIDWLTPYGIIDTTAMEGITSAEFPWAHLAGSIVVSNIECDVENAGEQQLINLLKAKITQAELSIKDTLYQALWGARASAEEIWSIVDMVDSSNPTNYATVGNFGNISRSTYTWWGSTEWDAVSEMSDATLTVTMVDHLYNDVANGTDEPDLIIMGQDLFEAYTTLLQKQYIYTDEDLGNAGIRNIKHLGANIVLDKQCTSGVIYALNTKYIQFITCQGRNFSTTEFQSVPNQDVKVALIRWSGQLACSNCSRQGKATGVTAT